MYLKSLMWCLTMASSAAMCQDPLLEVVIVNGVSTAALGVFDSASEGVVNSQALQQRLILRPTEVLEAVPGMVVTQHSGDGKASQYFLRGFNLDHGTDFSVSLDGMPMNMPSHGHGQGYANLNVLIPEMLTALHFRKGSYFVGDGDFSLAGSAALRYQNQLDRPFAQLTLGPNNYRRSLLAGSTSRDDQHWLGALEVLGNDGPWDNPQGVRKGNMLLRYSQGSSAEGFSVTGMLHQNAWNASDQIPQRTVDAGLLPRFGTVDPTDGGRSSRASLSGQWHQRTAQGNTDVSAYVVRSALQLWSNFTYNLKRPLEGDQFQQTDGRDVVGAAVRHERASALAGIDGALTFGASWRGDRVGDLGLYLTQARLRDSTVRQDKVSQDLLSVYAQQALQFSERWRGFAGLRLDNLHYSVRSQEPVFGLLNSGSGQASLFQPKAGLAWNVTPQHELYANAGVGFHSNDARGATITTDPQTGAGAQSVPAIVRGTGAELGWKFAPAEDFFTSVSLWTLKMGSELVFVGDAGTTEAGRPSRRAGLEFITRWVATPGLKFDLTWAQSRARFAGVPPAGDGNLIDNSVNRVISAAAVWQRDAWQTSLQLRHMGPRPLDTSGAVMSSSTTLLNARLGYVASKTLTLSLDVFNLTNRLANDIEYFYASCTALEVTRAQCGSGISDRHIHPQEPRSLRLTARWSL
jgi:outer membrane receptor protein involved in Fe transport